MKLRLQENEIRIIQEIENITGTDYEVKKGYIDVDNLMALIEDLKCEYDHQIELKEEREEDIRQNYKWVGNEWTKADMEYEAWRDNQ